MTIILVLLVFIGVPLTIIGLGLIYTPWPFRTWEELEKIENNIKLSKEK